MWTQVDVDVYIYKIEMSILVWKILMNKFPKAAYLKCCDYV